MTSTSHDTLSGRAAPPSAAPGADEQPDDVSPLTRASGPTSALELTAGEAAATIGVVGVAAIATCSLALAQFGQHNGALALGLGLGVTAVLAWLAWAFGGRPRVRIDVVELGLLAAVIGAALFFFLPGFPYAWVDKDPGVYVAHGFAIAREGDAYINDPVLDRGITPTLSLGGRFPGLWVENERPTSITVQFYHMFSSLLATAHDLGGTRALFNMNPLLAAGSVGVIVVAARRAAGTAVAALGGALLVVSMMQVWQAKYPSTEIPAQLLLAGALLAAVLAIDRRWVGGAFLTGALLGVGFLMRPDGFLYMLMALAGIALVIALGEADRRVWAFFAGAALTWPYAFWNAYVVRDTYSRANDVPRPGVLLGVMLLIIGAGYASQRALTLLRARYPGTELWRPAAAFAQPRWRVAVGAVVTLLAGGALLVYFYREQIFGIRFKYFAISDQVDRTYDELNLHWFAWFVTIRGLITMWLGIGVLMLRRWRARLFTLVLPGILLAYLYLWEPRVGMRLMWWVRRFIPAVLPSVILLIALALAFALTLRLTRRSVLLKAGAAVLAITLIVEWAGMSLDLRDHREMAGSWDMAAAIAAKAGDEQGVFLFPRGQSLYDINRNAPGTVWFVFDQVAARLPDGYDVTNVEEYQEAFPNQPVFVVSPGDTLPDNLPADRFSPAGVVTGELTILEETRGYRPEAQVVIPMGVSTWRYEADPQEVVAHRG